MSSIPYLIIGSSHAALEAASAIRLIDGDGDIVMLTRDGHAPYSPTVLPYVVSGRSEPENVALRDQAWFEDNNVLLRTGCEVASVDPAAHTVTQTCGRSLEYGKLLLASGAAPAIPPVKGLDEVPFHVLRTLDDATSLKAGLAPGGSALVMGAGLVGMHAAENLVEAGYKVTVVEMQDQVLPGYFDATAAGMIEAAFTDHGATMLMGRAVSEVAKSGKRYAATLDDGSVVESDLVLVATGVKPVVDYLDGSGVDTDNGVIVDEFMRTNQPDIWAAGDVAAADDFYAEGKSNIGILPNAVEQGRIAGMDMTDDTGVKPYPGGVPINTYRFFGRQALSVGLSGADAANGGAEVSIEGGPEAASYRSIVLRDGKLQGISGIDLGFDAGIMWQLIIRKIDIDPVKADFLAKPGETGRKLMSQNWR